MRSKKSYMILHDMSKKYIDDTSQYLRNPINAIILKFDLEYLLDQADITRFICLIGEYQLCTALFEFHSVFLSSLQ